MKCKKFAGNQNQSYRSVMKTLLLKDQTWGRCCSWLHRLELLRQA